MQSGEFYHLQDNDLSGSAASSTRAWSDRCEIFDRDRIGGVEGDGAWKVVPRFGRPPGTPLCLPARGLKVARIDGVNPHEALSWRDYVLDHRAAAVLRFRDLTDTRRRTGSETSRSPNPCRVYGM